MLARTNICVFRCECWPQPTSGGLAGTGDAGLLGGQAAQQSAEEDIEARLGTDAVVVVFLPPATDATELESVLSSMPPRPTQTTATL
jgi:hypothetical protein